MAVTIKNETKTKEVSLKDLDAGDTFLFHGDLYQYRARGYTSPGRPSDLCLVTKLLNGDSVRMGTFTQVEPVDIEITVLRK